jgi:hypothetical protein
MSGVWLCRFPNQQLAYYAISINGHMQITLYFIINQFSIYWHLLKNFHPAFSETAHAESGVWLCLSGNQHPAFYSNFINRHTYNIDVDLSADILSIIPAFIIFLDPALSKPAHARPGVWLCRSGNRHPAPGILFYFNQPAYT